MVLDYDAQTAIMDLRFLRDTAFFVIVGYLQLVASVATAEECGKRTRQLQITFQSTNLNAWQKEIRDQLRSSIANFVNVYCQSNASECGLKDSRPDYENAFDAYGDSNQFIIGESSTNADNTSINASNVIIIGTYSYAKNDGGSVLKIVIKLPARGVAARACKYLRKRVLKEIIKTNKQKLQEELLGIARTTRYTPAFSFGVTHLDGEIVGNEDLRATNEIAIPIIFGVLLMLVIFVVLVVCCRPIRKYYRSYIARRRTSSPTKEFRFSDLQRHFTGRHQDLPLIPKQVVERGPLVNSRAKILPRNTSKDRQHKKKQPTSRKVVVRENGRVEIVYSTYSDCTVIEMTRRHK